MKKIKAFTLIEVLLATAIFATILVMTTAVVGQSSTYRTKLIEERKAGEAVRAAADMLSTDLRAKTVPGTLRYYDSDFGDPSVTYEFKSGIAELFCSETVLRAPDGMEPKGGCAVVNNRVPYAGLISQNNGGDPYLNTASSATGGDPYAYDPIQNNDNYPANTLIIFLPGNKAKIYWSSRNILLSTGADDAHIIDKWAYSLYYKEVSFDSVNKLHIGRRSRINWMNNYDNGTGIDVTTDRITQFTDGEIGIIFGGYCPDDAATATPQQPYVRFFVGAKSLRYNSDPTKASTGYAYMPANARGIAEIVSSVTLRKYSE